MIKSYEEKHEKQVYSLLNGYPMNWAGQALGTVLAVDGKEVIGIGSISISELHPYREYINVYVQPEKRGNGTGTSIFSELFSLSQTKRFQATTSSKNTAAVSFLEEYGEDIEVDTTLLFTKINELDWYDSTINEEDRYSNWRVVNSLALNTLNDYDKREERENDSLHLPNMVM